MLIKPEWLIRTAKGAEVGKFGVPDFQASMYNQPVVKSSLFGFLIALAMLAPPIIHFLTGPLGPLVGGFFAGTRAKVTVGKSPIIGMMMALFMVAPITVLVTFSSVTENFLPKNFQNILVILGLGIVFYTFIMGTAGAALGGALIRRKS